MNKHVNITPDALALFSGARQEDHFNKMFELFPSKELKPSPTPYDFPQGEDIELPETYEFQGQIKSVEAFFTETDTAALLVLKDGKLCYERYALTGGKDVQWISWSVAKSFISSLVGIAIGDELIEGVDDQVVDYIPFLKGSSYDGASIKDVLQMSSGARWLEDYSNPESDVFRLAAGIYGIAGLDEFIAGMEREFEPGTLCRYNSADTQVLGTLVREVSGKSITDYMQEKLYDPLGMVSPGYWLSDKDNMEMAFGGLNITARDYAKFGELYRNKGMWQGKQIVPSEWVEASTKPLDDHVGYGKLAAARDEPLPFGYGYQWWVHTGGRGQYSANGVYNQMIFVDPISNVTIVRLSATQTFGLEASEKTNRTVETIEWLKAISESLD